MIVVLHNILDDAVENARITFKQVNARLARSLGCTGCNNDNISILAIAVIPSPQFDPASKRHPMIHVQCFPKRSFFIRINKHQFGYTITQQ
ncbi:hypothetical protein D3C77_439810 [compost metagenome]